jgi:hypothetical protein
MEDSANGAVLGLEELSQGDRAFRIARALGHDHLSKIVEVLRHDLQVWRQVLVGEELKQWIGHLCGIDSRLRVFVSHLILHKKGDADLFDVFYVAIQSPYGIKTPLVLESISSPADNSNIPFNISLLWIYAIKRGRTVAMSSFHSLELYTQDGTSLWNMDIP